MVGVRGGEKIDAYLKDKAKKLGSGVQLRVGFLEGATYPGGEVTNEAGKKVKVSDVSVATVAAAQNFGAPSRGIPARPFFTNMVAEKKDEWGPAVALHLKQQNYDVVRTLEIVGQGIKGQLQQSIIDTNSPPLSSATVERKGFDKPLIDTSIMLNSVDYEVEQP